MIKNYLKIAIRGLLRQKGYSVINLTGLALGMSLLMLIVLVTVSYQSLKAAYANPVESLRYE